MVWAVCTRVCKASMSAMVSSSSKRSSKVWPAGISLLLVATGSTPSVRPLRALTVPLQRMAMSYCPQSAANPRKRAPPLPPHQKPDIRAAEHIFIIFAGKQSAGCAYREITLLVSQLGISRSSMQNNKRTLGKLIRKRLGEYILRQVQERPSWQNNITAMRERLTCCRDRLYT